MKSLIYSLLFSISLLIGCTNTTSEAVSISDTTSDTISTDLPSVDTLVNSQTDSVTHDTTLQLLDVRNWKTEDFIVHSKDKKNSSIKASIEYDREFWADVKSPFVAKYTGCDFGDYFHLNFEDERGTRYDFGFGENNLGEYELYNKDDFEDNPKYLGKTFTIYWNWKVSSFPCCEGDYYPVEAYQPSIVKLESE